MSDIKLYSLKDMENYILSGLGLVRLLAVRGNLEREDSPFFSDHKIVHAHAYPNALEIVEITTKDPNSDILQARLPLEKWEFGLIPGGKERLNCLAEIISKEKIDAAHLRFNPESYYQEKGRTHMLYPLQLYRMLTVQ